MPYLGNAPSATFQSVAYQDLTGGTGTSFTLSHAVSSAQELEVFVNNVRQEPTVAYTAVGTTLTMTGTIAATDDFYVVFQGKTVGSVSHPTTSPLAATTGTFSGNVTSSGTVTASSFSGDGSALTGVSAGKVLTGDWVNYNDGLSLTSNTSFTEISTSFRPSITVQDTSSRIQIIGQITGMSYTGNDFPYYRIERSINGGAFSGEESTGTTDNTALNAKQNSSSAILGFAAGAGMHTDNGDGIDTTTFNWIWDHDATAGDTLTLRFMVRTRTTNFRLNFTSNNGSTSLSAISGFGMIEVLI